ncbi:MAG: domain, putative AbiEii toxin, type system [Bacteroidota bacterium]|jgi:AAA15 family ATPase/GTPase|nr:domain, putative AbiEii toxin, type system [Bacteroidota bacterium]
MLLSFKVKNYLSFRNEVCLNLLPSSNKDNEENIAYISTTGTRVLKSAVIYGANSSGKSNLLKALIFMKKFVFNSSKETQANELIAGVDSFRLNSETEVLPSEFEVIFFHEGIKYRYGFTLDNFTIHKESLHFTKISKEYTYFVRTGNTIQVDEKLFSEGKDLVTRTRNNTLFLSAVAQWNGPISMSILKWFDNSLKYITDTNKQYHQDKTSKLFESDLYRSWILKFLSYADLGFSELILEKRDLSGFEGMSKQVKEILMGEMRGGTKVRTKHMQYNNDGEEVGQVYFDLNKNESLGTQKLYAISGMIIDSLATGKVLIVDEFDARLHPNLSSSIIKLFNSRINNPKNAQLIFVTHNTNLLSKKVLRRDQIILAEKDSKFGSTTLTSLMDKKVRNDEAYEKNYLEGEYGAVPEMKGDLNLFDNFQ